MTFTYYKNAQDIPQCYHDDLMDMGLTDEQKVEVINNLQNIVQQFHDMAYGLGQYSSPNHDAAAWRAEQAAYYEAEDKKTPEELCQDGCDYWMEKYGKYYKKKHGAEAAAAKCRQYGEEWAQGTLRSRERWREFKKIFDQPQATAPYKSKKARGTSSG